MSDATPHTQSARTPLPLIRLAALPGDVDADTATANIRMTIGRQPLHLEIAVSAGTAHTEDLLPVFQGLANTVVDVGIAAVERQGLTVSCRKGCGACCRQPVPISETEARFLARLVDGFPEPRRSQVRTRFDAARRRLAEAGLLEAFQKPQQMAGAQIRQLGLAYFGLGVPCPFLEEESCSIHADRPLACREYLVTSPAELCSQPNQPGLRRVPIPAEVAGALRSVDRKVSASGAGWVLLALAPEWVAAHPESPTRPGPELLQEFFTYLMNRPDGILEDNLRPFLTALGWVVGYDFSAGDWTAVSDGVRGTDSESDRWYEFELTGRQQARLRLARDAAVGLIRLKAEVPAGLEVQVRLIVTIFRQFHVRDTGDDAAGR